MAAQLLHQVLKRYVDMSIDTIRINLSHEQATTLEDSTAGEGEENSSEFADASGGPSSFSSSLPASTPTMLGAEYVMKIRDGKQLTQVATDGILQDTKLLIETTVENIERKIMEKLNNQRASELSHCSCSIEIVDIYVWCRPMQVLRILYVRT